MLTLRSKQLSIYCILIVFMLFLMPLAVSASDYGPRDLVQGAQGEAVIQLQKDLGLLGFYAYSVDGSFGPRTYTAVVDFQASRGLKTDGVVGPITKNALNLAISQTGSSNPQDLIQGSQGAAVSQLQENLKTLGFYTASIDGSFGTKTYAAVLNFQASRGLKTDGVVGSITKAALKNAVSGVKPKASASAKAPTAASIKHYNSHEKPIVDAFRASYDGSPAQALVGRAIWYMEYGYMKYGHTKYPATGYIDCSNFVSLVYKDFGYSITSAARNYGSVGVKVQGVSAQKIPGSTKYALVGIDKLKPGDIFTYWNSDAPAKTRIGHVAIYGGHQWQTLHHKYLRR